MNIRTLLSWPAVLIKRFLSFFRKSHVIFEIFAKLRMSRQIQTEFLAALVYDKGNFHILWRFRKDEYHMQKVSKE